MNQIKLFGQKVRITKEIDNTNGNHINGINQGYVKEGIPSDNLELGYCFYVLGENNSMFRSTPVIEIAEDGSWFKAKNSTYKIENI